MSDKEQGRAGSRLDGVTIPEAGIRMEVILEQAEERARLRRERDEANAKVAEQARTILDVCEERDETRAERDEARDMEALTRGMLTGAEARRAAHARSEVRRALEEAIFIICPHCRNTEDHGLIPSRAPGVALDLHFKRKFPDEEWGCPATRIRALAAKWEEKP